MASIQRLSLCTVYSGLPAFANSQFPQSATGYRRGMTTTAEHLRNTLDGRWRDVKNRMRSELSDELRPHYTPNTVIARTKVAEQLKIMAAAGAAEDGFKKEHGGNGDVGAAVTQIEMLAMSDCR